MRWLRALLIAAGLLPFVPSRAFATGVKVIANASVKADIISAPELRRIFLQESGSLGDGTRVQPVIEKDGPVHKAFLQQYLGRTQEDLQTYYRALVFTGRGSMPKVLGSDAEVVAYVAATRGAIGYVSSDSDTTVNGVKTLLVIPAGNTAERRLLTSFEPKYPETLQRLGIGGTVRLALTVAPKGNVENVALLGGNPILAESAILAVKRWTYAVARSRSTIEVSIPFDPGP
ncbi:MAG: TonB family protein [Candidatus Sulfotelmatobacter sp.]